jgi:hypothetical protein
MPTFVTQWGRGSGSLQMRTFVEWQLLQLLHLTGQLLPPTEAQLVGGG